MFASSGTRGRELDRESNVGPFGVWSTFGVWYVMRLARGLELVVKYSRSGSGYRAYIFGDRTDCVFRDAYEAMRYAEREAGERLAVAKQRLQQVEVLT